MLRIISIVMLSIMIILEFKITFEDIIKGTTVGSVLSMLIIILFTSVPYIYIVLK